MMPWRLFGAACKCIVTTSHVAAATIAIIGNVTVITSIMLAIAIVNVVADTAMHRL